MKRRNGFTIIEVIVAMIMLAIIIFGAIAYRYHAALDSKRAEVDILANRIGLLLLESWHGFYGYNPSTHTYSAYNPVLHLQNTGAVIGLDITTSAGPARPDVTYNALGSYKITLNEGNNLNYIVFYSTLSSKDAGGSLGMTIINVTVQYSQRGNSAASLGDCEKTISLTTYRYQ